MSAVDCPWCDDTHADVDRCPFRALCEDDPGPLLWEGDGG